MSNTWGKAFCMFLIILINSNEFYKIYIMKDTIRYITNKDSKKIFKNFQVNKKILLTDKEFSISDSYIAINNYTRIENNDPGLT